MTREQADVEISAHGLSIVEIRKDMYFGGDPEKTPEADNHKRIGIKGKSRYAWPREAEMCGPAFTPDNRTLFVAVQHPGEDKDSTFDNPSTRRPDFDFRNNTPPRPSVVAITREDGGVIGS